MRSVTTAVVCLFGCVGCDEAPPPPDEAPRFLCQPPPVPPLLPCTSAPTVESWAFELVDDRFAAGVGHLEAMSCAPEPGAPTLAFLTFSEASGFAALERDPPTDGDEGAANRSAEFTTAIFGSTAAPLLALPSTERGDRWLFFAVDIDVDASVAHVALAHAGASTGVESVIIDAPLRPVPPVAPRRRSLRPLLPWEPATVVFGRFADGGPLIDGTVADGSDGVTALPSPTRAATIAVAPAGLWRDASVTVFVPDAAPLDFAVAHPPPATPLGRLAATAWGDVVDDGDGVVVNGSGGVVVDLGVGDFDIVTADVDAEFGPGDDFTFFAYDVDAGVFVVDSRSAGAFGERSVTLTAALCAPSRHVLAAIEVNGSATLRLHRIDGRVPSL